MSKVLALLVVLGIAIGVSADDNARMDEDSAQQAYVEEVIHQLLYVNAPLGLNARSGPGTQYATMHTGTSSAAGYEYGRPVIVTRTDGDWAFTSDGVYVHSDWLSDTRPVVERPAAVNAVGWQVIGQPFADEDVTIDFHLTTSDFRLDTPHHASENPYKTIVVNDCRSTVDGNLQLDYPTLDEYGFHNVMAWHIVVDNDRCRIAFVPEFSAS